MPAPRPVALLLSCWLLTVSQALAGTIASPGPTETLDPEAKAKRVAPHAPPLAAPVPRVEREGPATHGAPDAKPPAHATQARPREAAPRQSQGHNPPSVAKPAPSLPGHGAPQQPPPPDVAAPAPAAATAEPAKPAPPSAPPKGTVTGLPLPRFAALRSDEVNLRAGPGTRYPIDWVYKRRDLPVEIDREFDVWRLIKDEDGVKGWVHEATLTGRRAFVVTGAERTLRSGPKDDAAPVALLKPGVVGRLRSCEAAAAWCQVQIGEYGGWLRRGEFWGSYPGEAINP